MDKQDKLKQLELFSHSAESKDTERLSRSFFHHHINLSIEHIIVLSVVLLMAVVFSFSLGVEKGKRITGVSEEVIITAEKQIDEPAAVIEIKEEPPAQEILPKEEIFAYTIQVASFKKKASVEEESKRLQKKGYETLIIPKGNWIILCVGKFNNKQDAEVLWQELRKKYSDCIIRKI